MRKPNEVLFRLHNINAPKELNIDVNRRDDDFLRAQHEKLGVLPGEKVFETNLPKDGPWKLGGVVRDLAQAGYRILNMSVELRPIKNSDKFKPVLSINFGLAGDATTTPEQNGWIVQLLSGATFKLAQAYLNPRTDGTTLLALDCANAVQDGSRQVALPLGRLLGQSATSSAKTQLV